MKRILLTLLAVAALVGVLAGVGFGSAATVAIDGKTLQAGQDSVPDASGSLDVIWKTMTSVDTFRVIGVRLEGNPTDLAVGKKVLVAIFESPGAQIGFLAGEVTTAGEVDCTKAYSGGWVEGGLNILASDVHSVAIVIKDDWHPYDGNPFP